MFSNIARAEQRHTDAILCLLNKYDLTDPVGANAPGVFQNTTLQTLYNTLIAEGKQNKIAALTVGAKIEDLDISDLEKALTDINNADIIAVFGELNRGSRNHLRAFVTNLQTLGVQYVPAYISVKQFEEIIAAPREKGGSICGTCPNANNPACAGNGNCNGPKGKNGCMGNGPNGNNNCVGNSPKGNKACPGNSPKGKGNGNGGNGNGGNGKGGN